MKIGGPQKAKHSKAYTDRLQLALKMITEAKLLDNPTNEEVSALLILIQQKLGKINLNKKVGD